MSLFSYFGKSIELPASLVLVKATTRDNTAWLCGVYTTVRLVKKYYTLRVHTAGRAYEEREASAEMGAWVLLGDIIQTSAQLANSRSLPTYNPNSMVAFTHTSEAILNVGTVLNIGLASAKFGGRGGDFQAEHVSGPSIQFKLLEGKHWHGKAGLA
jgi:hypothetical protein